MSISPGSLLTLSVSLGREIKHGQNTARRKTMMIGKFISKIEIRVKLKLAMLNLCECLNSDFKNPKQFWRKIKSFNSKDKHIINQIRVDDTIVHDPLSVAQALNQHFSSVCSALLPVSYTNNDSCANTPTSRSAIFSFRKITPTEVWNAIMESNGNSSAGLKNSGS